MSKWVVLSALAFLLSLIVTPIVIKFIRHFKMYDAVNERSSHKVSTLRGGGLSFVIVLVVLYSINSMFSIFPLSPLSQIIFLCSLAIAIIGFIDDNYSLPFSLRLCLQLALVIYPATHLPLFDFAVPAIVQYALFSLAWVWFINLFNFIDGTNGFACQQAIFLCLFLLLVPGGLTAPVCAILFAVLGFLPYNFPKAKIFMGDVGSTFLGYLLGGLVLIAATYSSHYTLPIFALTLLSTGDTTYTLIRRLIKKEKVWTAHRSHWYQRIYNMGYSHSVVFIYGAFCNAFLLGLYLLLNQQQLLVLDLPLSLLIMAIAWLAISRMEKEKACSR